MLNFTLYVLFVLFMAYIVWLCRFNAKFQTLYAENRKSKIKWKSLPLRSDKMDIKWERNR